MPRVRRSLSGQPPPTVVRNSQSTPPTPMVSRSVSSTTTAASDASNCAVEPSESGTDSSPASSLERDTESEHTDRGTRPTVVVSTTTRSSSIRQLGRSPAVSVLPLHSCPTRTNRSARQAGSIRSATCRCPWSPRRPPSGRSTDRPCRGIELFCTSSTWARTRPGTPVCRSAIVAPTSV